MFTTKEDIYNLSQNNFGHKTCSLDLTLSVGHLDTPIQSGLQMNITSISHASNIYIWPCHVSEVVVVVQTSKPSLVSLALV